jgi:ABC transport system ATP-binding/permease protein
MASRWAFEATMVTQFKDNPFEKEWYQWDQEAANAEYKKLYYLPKLESELSYCFKHIPNKTGPDRKRMEQALQLLHDEIGKELRWVGTDQFPAHNRLTIHAFDTAVYKQTSAFLAVLNKVYVNRFNQASAQKEAQIDHLTKTPEDLEKFEARRKKYQNEAVMAAVKNTGTPFRIIEYKGRLIRKIYPIYYQESQPVHVFDYTAKFYVPTKHFLGQNISTYWFNLLAIWAMVVILALALYVDALKRLVTWMEPNRKQRGKK